MRFRVLRLRLLLGAAAFIVAALALAALGLTLLFERHVSEIAETWGATLAFGNDAIGFRVTLSIPAVRKAPPRP